MNLNDLPWYGCFGEGDMMRLNKNADLTGIQRYVMIEDIASIPQRDTCKWTMDKWGCNHDTQCGETWWFEDGTWQENGIKFCPYCGGRIE